MSDRLVVARDVDVVRVELDLPDAEHIHLTRRPDGTITAVPMARAVLNGTACRSPLWIDIDGGA